jgi:hypothetical protein
MTTQDIGLGIIAKDNITGYEGVIVAHSRYLNNCDRFMLQARGIEDGKSPDPYAFDLPNLVYVGPSGTRVIQPGAEIVIPTPGVWGKDKLTGIEGTVTSVTTFSNGCVRGILQPRGLHKGKPIDVVHFDAHDLEFTPPAVAPPKRDTGGPQDLPRYR